MFSFRSNMFNSCFYQCCKFILQYWESVKLMRIYGLGILMVVIALNGFNEN